MRDGECTMILNKPVLFNTRKLINAKYVQAFSRQLKLDFIFILYAKFINMEGMFSAL